MKKCDMIIDLQYGSTGKGLIAGYMANEHNYDMTITANMPNAGHTYIDKHGNKFIHKVLPNALACNHAMTAMIGPGAVFDVARLYDELKVLLDAGYAQHSKVMIHENAVVLDERHHQAENSDVIGSTRQGAGAALIEKILRPAVEDTPLLARDVMSDDEVFNIYIVTAKEYRLALEMAENVLLEAAQGFSLGISEKFYPFCTSRDCTPARFMADMAVPLPMLRSVIGCARVHPIRVGGTSGGCYDDQKEIKWSDIGVEPELTTVTGRERRIFSYSEEQIEDAIMACRPDSVFLNFCNYDPDKAKEVQIHINETLSCYETETESRVEWAGWGPNHNDVRYME